MESRTVAFGHAQSPELDNQERKFLYAIDNNLTDTSYEGISSPEKKSIDERNPILELIA